MGVDRDFWWDVWYHRSEGLVAVTRKYQAEQELFHDIYAQEFTLLYSNVPDSKLTVRWASVRSAESGALLESIAIRYTSYQGSHDPPAKSFDIYIKPGEGSAFSDIKVVEAEEQGPADFVKLATVVTK